MLTGHEPFVRMQRSKSHLKTCMPQILKPSLDCVVAASLALHHTQPNTSTEPWSRGKGFMSRDLR